MVAAYSRSQPSPRYVELLDLYSTMHQEGDPSLGLPPEQTFAGGRLGRLADLVKKLVTMFGAQTVLDYGAGKGLQYREAFISDDGQSFPDVGAYWGVESVTCYDPGYQPFSRLPEGRFDGVVCTDVLEHCPEEDLRWILHEMFAYATRFVFGNIASYPAKKMLPNGENAHCTQQSHEWWESLIREVAVDYPGVKFLFTVDYFVSIGNGQMKQKCAAISG